MLEPGADTWLYRDVLRLAQLDSAPLHWENQEQHLDLHWQSASKKKKKKERFYQDWDFFFKLRTILTLRTTSPGSIGTGIAITRMLEIKVGRRHEATENFMIYGTAKSQHHIVDGRNTYNVVGF